MITITFEDGNVIEVAEKQGEYYIFDEVPAITGDSTEFTVTEDDDTTVITNAQFVSCTSEDGRPWFMFMPIPNKQEIASVQADVDYLAMETGVDL